MADQFVTRVYTRVRHVRIYIAKYDGRWRLPGGPYTIPEAVTAVGGLLATVYLTEHLWSLWVMPAGVAVTWVGVLAMRRFPYSNVRLSSRAVWLYRLLATPRVSTTKIAPSPDVVAATRPVRIYDAAPVIRGAAEQRLRISAEAARLLAGAAPAPQRLFT
jgi:hypothetical protein